MSLDSRLPSEDNDGLFAMAYKVPVEVKAGSSQSGTGLMYSVLYGSLGFLTCITIEPLARIAVGLADSYRLLDNPNINNSLIGSLVSAFMGISLGLSENKNSPKPSLKDQ